MCILKEFKIKRETERENICEIEARIWRRLMRDPSLKDAPLKTSIMLLDLHFSNALGFRGEISDGRDIERNILLYTRSVEVSNNLLWLVQP